ncbi:MAG: hypothetical protein KGI06_05080 [Candidatus Micrarchaeota archaeon]|nr:hypothetical protein [Candidatus Micrarchaeota archaeon]
MCDRKAAIEIRNFLTDKELLEMMKDYRRSLETEVRELSKRIEMMENN